MKEGDEYYKVEMLVSKRDLDHKVSKIKSEFAHYPSIIFDAIENNGIKVYKVRVNRAKARTVEKHITLDVSQNGYSSSRKGWL